MMMMYNLPNIHGTVS